MKTKATMPKEMQELVRQRLDERTKEVKDLLRQVQEWFKDPSTGKVHDTVHLSKAPNGNIKVNKQTTTKVPFEAWAIEKAAEAFNDYDGCHAEYDGRHECADFVIE